MRPGVQILTTGAHFLCFFAIQVLLRCPIQVKVLDCPSVPVRGCVKIFHRGRDVGMAHQVFDCHNVNAFRRQCGSKGMPKIMYPKMRQPSFSSGHIKTPPYAGLFWRLARSREYHLLAGDVPGMLFQDFIEKSRLGPKYLIVIFIPIFRSYGYHFGIKHLVTVIARAVSLPWHPIGTRSGDWSRPVNVTPPVRGTGRSHPGPMDPAAR